RAQRTLDRREGTDLGVPRNAVGVAPLHLEQLILLHPRAEGALHAAGVARHDPLGREALGAREPRDQPARRGHQAAGPLFEHGLPQVTRRNADVLAQGEQLGLGEAVSDVVLPRLQLGRALNDALQGLSADELAGHRYASVLVFAGGAVVRRRRVPRAAVAATPSRVCAVLACWLFWWLLCTPAPSRPRSPRAPPPRTQGRVRRARGLVAYRYLPTMNSTGPTPGSGA